MMFRIAALDRDLVNADAKSAVPVTGRLRWPDPSPQSNSYESQCHNTQLAVRSWRKWCADSTLATGQATTRAASGLTYQGPVAYRIRLELNFFVPESAKNGVGWALALLARAIRANDW
jgi:hypothetical protein